jgi:hypothetical protein
MSQLLLLVLIVVAFGALCFGSGYLAVFIVTRKNWRADMIRRGAARYNSQTGKWEWASSRKSRDIECPAAASRRLAGRNIAASTRPAAVEPRPTTSSILLLPTILIADFFMQSDAIRSANLYFICPRCSLTDPRFAAAAGGAYPVERVGGRKEYRVGPLEFVAKAAASPENCDRNEGQAAFSATLVDRRSWRRIRREGQRQAQARLRLLRGGARPAIGGEATQQR